MLEIVDLHVSVAGTPILKGLRLGLRAGETAAIMGPNGSGKSTLARVLAGHPDYEVTAGSVRLEGRDLLAMGVEERALAGVFLGFQHPVEVPGVASSEFLRMAFNARRRHLSRPELDPLDFDMMLEEKMGLVGMGAAFKGRMLNAGFSGGEKKRNEILQMAVLDPKLAVLDEIDSGLDIDALRAVGAGITALRGADRSLLLITHYQRLLDYVTPDTVHVMSAGRIVRSGGRELALELERQGYDGVGMKS